MNISDIPVPTRTITLFLLFFSFLLDRLLQYEKPDESSSDSDATASSDSEAEARDGPPKR
jgi:hypothetical protein